MINSREIRELLRGNVDPRLGKVLVSLSEDNHTLKQQVMLLAQMFDQMCNLLNMQGAALGAVKQAQIAEMRRRGVEISTDPTLTGEANEQ